MANSYQTLVFFDMPSSVTVDKKGGKSVIVRSTCNEKSCITFMLGVTVNDSKFPPYVILKRKNFQRNSYWLGLFLEQRKSGG